MRANMYRTYTDRQANVNEKKKKPRVKTRKKRINLMRTPQIEIYGLTIKIPNQTVHVPNC